MIKSIDDLDFTTLSECKTKEEINTALDDLLKSKLDISLSVILEAVSKSIIDKVDILANKLHGVSPNGDYSKYVEDKKEIINIINIHGANIENLMINSIDVDDKKDLLKLKFYSKGIDDGKTLFAICYLDFNGNIKHVYPQIILL